MEFNLKQLKILERLLINSLNDGYNEEEKQLLNHVQKVIKEIERARDRAIAWLDAGYKNRYGYYKEV